MKRESQYCMKNQPKKGETYWYINRCYDGIFCQTTWAGRTVDYIRWDIENCFPTKEDAEIFHDSYAYTEKYIQFCREMREREKVEKKEKETGT